LADEAVPFDTFYKTMYLVRFAAHTLNSVEARKLMLLLMIFQIAVSFDGAANKLSLN
jgi:hypothetical protein